MLKFREIYVSDINLEVIFGFYDILYACASLLPSHSSQLPREIKRSEFAHSCPEKWKAQSLLIVAQLFLIVCHSAQCCPEGSVTVIRGANQQNAGKKGKQRWQTTNNIKPSIVGKDKEQMGNSIRSRLQFLSQFLIVTEVKRYRRKNKFMD